MNKNFFSEVLSLSSAKREPLIEKVNEYGFTPLFLNHLSPICENFNNKVRNRNSDTLTRLTSSINSVSSIASISSANSTLKSPEKLYEDFQELTTSSYSNAFSRPSRLEKKRGRKGKRTSLIPNRENDLSLGREGSPLGFDALFFESESNKNLNQNQNHSSNQEASLSAKHSLSANNIKENLIGYRSKEQKSQRNLKGQGQAQGQKSQRARRKKSSLNTYPYSFLTLFTSPSSLPQLDINSFVQDFYQQEAYFKEVAKLEKEIATEREFLKKTKVALYRRLAEQGCDQKIMASTYYRFHHYCDSYLAKLEQKKESLKTKYCYSDSKQLNSTKTFSYLSPNAIFSWNCFLSSPSTQTKNRFPTQDKVVRTSSTSVFQHLDKEGSKLTKTVSKEQEESDTLNFEDKITLATIKHKGLSLKLSPLEEQLQALLPKVKLLVKNSNILSPPQVNRFISQKIFNHCLLSFNLDYYLYFKNLLHSTCNAYSTSDFNNTNNVSKVNRLDKLINNQGRRAKASNNNIAQGVYYGNSLHSYYYLSCNIYQRKHLKYFKKVVQESESYRLSLNENYSIFLTLALPGCFEQLKYISSSVKNIPSEFLDFSKGLIDKNGQIINELELMTMDIDSLIERLYIPEVGTLEGARASLARKEIYPQQILASEVHKLELRDLEPTTERVIFHIDLNNCYASIEVMLNPALKGKAIAVTGAIKERKGIVLAKSYEAKAYGVQTGEPIVQAQRKCPHLLCVPPHYREYEKVSQQAHEIYSQYTNKVEAFGIDECWLDVTEVVHEYPSPLALANVIRERIKNEIGVTCSIGISFNKIFAKLGSDMKKPDACTEIPFSSWQDKVWPLNISEMVSVGRRNQTKLNQLGIYTLGDLAKADLELLDKHLGFSGKMLWINANGLNYADVSEDDYEREVKSVGHGTTCRYDLTSSREILVVLRELAEDIAIRLRDKNLCASAVQLSIVTHRLKHESYQLMLPRATYSALEISDAAYEIFCNFYRSQQPVRALTIRAVKLSPLVLEQPIEKRFTRVVKHGRALGLQEAMYNLRKRYGAKACTFGSTLFSKLTPSRSHMPFGEIRNSLPN